MDIERGAGCGQGRRKTHKEIHFIANDGCRGTLGAIEHVWMENEERGATYDERRGNIALGTTSKSGQIGDGMHFDRRECSQLPAGRSRPHELNDGWPGETDGARVEERSEKGIQSR